MTREKLTQPSRCVKAALRPTFLSRAAGRVADRAMNPQI
jgi:hypothetical protein